MFLFRRVFLSRWFVVFAIFAFAPLLFSCSTALEIYMASEEPPSVEMALDRVNTSARALELQEIMLKALPISAASSWPGNMDRAVPKGDDERLGEILLQDSMQGRGGGFRSPVRLKVLVMQSALFDTFPSMYYDRKYFEKAPSPEAIAEYGRKILGDGYNPAFNKSFYRFMRFTPDFRPKKALFEGTLEGKSAEFYSSVEEAVISLADNAETLERIRNDMAEADEQKKRFARDVSEGDATIRAFKQRGRGDGFPEVVSAKEEMEIQKKEYDAAANRYGELLKGWKIELSKIKKQATAFNDEQMALAKNIQAAVNASKGLYADSVALVTIALIKFPESVRNLPQELKEMAKSRNADVRISRIFLNLESLPENASIVKTGLGQLYEEADSMDGLFESRIKTATKK